jgi:hypothetical protein
MLNDTYTLVCVCLSTVMHNSYFYFEGACQECFSGCRCNEQGCFYCEEWTLRVPLGGGCGCRYPYVQGNTGACVCVEPYYSINNSTCECISLINSTGYVYDNLSQHCYRCPEKCECDDSGCFKCDSSANRIVSIMSDGHWSCAQCIYSAELVDGECQCGSDGMLSEYNP